jgi:hypothetical protein
VSEASNRFQIYPRTIRRRLAVGAWKALGYEHEARRWEDTRVIDPDHVLDDDLPYTGERSPMLALMEHCNSLILDREEARVALAQALAALEVGRLQLEVARGDLKGVQAERDELAQMVEELQRAVAESEARADTIRRLEDEVSAEWAERSRLANENMELREAMDDATQRGGWIRRRSNPAHARR